MLVAVLATLASVALFYLSDRQQRWLDQPLPAWTRLIALLMLVGGVLLLTLQLGVSVGLFVGLWVFTLPALLVPLIVSHYRDSYQRRGGSR
ncbi:hypothetical protein [Alcanivorax sp.]|jgi:hypothetical protein|uniref:hypothetical protein n=1 Tax=Alcanivorax sp. TaxID=1872427 RepID=UPI0032D9190B